MKCKLRSFFALLTVVTVFAGCVTRPVLNLNNVNVPATTDGVQPSYDVVQKAIIKACKFRGWIPTVKEKGVIDATLRTRGHIAQINIKFDTTQYSIYYVSSENLSYKNGKIHKNYNKWIGMLSSTIQKYLI
jgi:hypothetical protein